MADSEYTSIIWLTQGFYTIVDNEDYEWLMQRKWYIADAVRQPRAKTKVLGKHVLLSRYIMNPPGNLVVDHINGIKLDNRRINLRICTQRENSRNKSPHKDSKAGVKGVNQNKNRYQASIRLAYNKAAIEHFGEFAKINIL